MWQWPKYTCAEEIQKQDSPFINLYVYKYKYRYKECISHICVYVYVCIHFLLTTTMANEHNTA